MKHKILFRTDLPAKTRIRVNGHGIHQFNVKVPKSSKKEKFIVISSDFAKQNKIMLYPDIVSTGEAAITIINITPYPVDLEEGDVIGNFISLPSHCDCNNETE